MATVNLCHTIYWPKAHFIFVAFVIPKVKVWALACNVIILIACFLYRNICQFRNPYEVFPFVFEVFILIA